MLQGVSVPEVGRKVEVDGEVRTVVCGIEGYPNILAAQSDDSEGVMLIPRDWVTNGKA